MDGNREYKSDVFSMLMEDPSRALSLYNALNDTNYQDPNDVEMLTLEGKISLTVKNDASFLLDSNLSIYEHQSSVCPNMPMRCLVYYGLTMKKLLKGTSLYGRALVKIPTPHFVVLYNGNENQPEKYELKLSDAFEKPTDSPEVELACMLYNINKGNNKGLLDKCKWLNDYMSFVDYCRYYLSKFGEDEYEAALDAAMDRCIKEGILAEFFTINREAVKRMELWDFTYETWMEEEKRTSHAEGLAEGSTQMLLSNIKSLMSKLSKSADEVMDMLEVPQEDRERYYQELV